MLFLTVACRPETNDLSNFTRFSYVVDEAYEQFCADLGPLSAHVERQTSGEYRFEATILVEGVPEADGCAEDVFVREQSGRQCVARQVLPTRTMTQAEVRELQDVFRQVTFDNRDPSLECDAPCRRETFTWDDLVLDSDYCFSPPYLPGEDRRAIMSVLSDLVGVAAEE